MAIAAAVVTFSLLLSRSCVRAQRAEDAGGGQGSSNLLWGMHISAVPLSTTGKSLDGPDLADDLSKIALAGFKRYVDTILPKELELDHDFSEVFAVADHSRTNAAFRAWQLRSLANFTHADPRSLANRGEALEYVPGVEYSWRELYESPLYIRLLNKVVDVAKVYLHRSGYDKDSLLGGFNIVTWVEVFEKGDAHRPVTRTDGSYLTGRFFSAYTDGAIKFQFEDPRGINPPYGKTHAFNPYKGVLLLYPSWASTFTTPSLAKESVVSFCFSLYPPGGKRIPWHDDRTGDMKVMRGLNSKERK